MDCIYIAPLSKAVYNLCLSFTHSHTHSHTMQGTNQLVRGNWGLGVLLWDTSTCPGWDRTGNPSDCHTTALPPEPYRPPNVQLRTFQSHPICDLAPQRVKSKTGKSIDLQVLLNLLLLPLSGKCLGVQRLPNWRVGVQTTPVLSGAC